VVPTLTAGPKLSACVRSLQQQTITSFEIVVVDNSGTGLVSSSGAVDDTIAVIQNDTNVGFGAAINQGARERSTPYVATLNDDAVARPDWLERLLAAAAQDERTGMWAPRVMLVGAGKLDSAGMLICGDGTSKQRGQGLAPEALGDGGEVLFPSGSAALYRRAMLDAIGWFDDRFFLYCEDTDLGLRGRWAGWRCSYVEKAVVEHHYSKSAGRASPLKAYFVERNRLFVVAKNFPARLLWRVPFAALTRYFWHVAAIVRGRGAAADFGREGHNPLALPWFVLKAHLALLAALPWLWKERSGIQRKARISAPEFCALLARHTIRAKEVASL
jgi:GT2 family glycosyltransferase